MRQPFLLAALAAALFLPARGSASEMEWTTARDGAEVIQLEVPVGYEELKSAVSERVLTLGWPSPVEWKGVRVEINGYKWGYPLDSFVKSQINRLKGAYKGGEGRHELLEGFEGRFVNIPDDEASLYMGYSEAKMAGGFAYVITLNLNRKNWEPMRASFDRILDSFKVEAPPVDTHTVPKGWKELKEERFSFMGPVDAVDPKVRDAQERPLHLVKSWLDNPDGPLKWYRDFLQDRRKFMPRRVIHIFADAAAFKAALGTAYRDGMKVRYLETHPDKPVVVLASEASMASKEEVLVECGIQYLEMRMGALQPWMRSGFRGYWQGSILRDFPGALHYEYVEKAKDLLKRPPVKYADLITMTEEEIQALGPAGDVLCWVHLHFQRHNPDASIMGAFGDFLRAAQKSRDTAAAWAETHPKEDGKKIDTALGKWIKEQKGTK